MPHGRLHRWLANSMKLAEANRPYPCHSSSVPLIYDTAQPPVMSISPKYQLEAS